MTYCCLDTTSRDFARFGLLYLHRGLWGNHAVVPQQWVAHSLAPSASYAGYGYQWWLHDPKESRLPDDMFAARGHDGQFIYVIPSLDLVVVRNGSYVKYEGEPIADPNLFEKYPSDGLVEGLGTRPPENGWDEVKFLTPIIEAIDSGR